MGLLDSLKNIQDWADQAKSIAGQIKDKVGFTSSESTPMSSPQTYMDAEDDESVLTPNSSGQIIIDSVGQMSSWLNSLSQQSATAVTLKVLDSQMQVIKFVKTPSLLGMVLDNMIATLYQTMKQASTKKEKEDTREIMSAMIQNLVFFADAQLHYMIDKNKGEAKQLLSQAGDMLAKSVANVAVFAAGPGAIAGVVLKNVFDSEEVQNGFFGKLVGWAVDKTQIVEKKKDFNKTLQNMFETFDKHSQLIGSSIQIHGMLSRYKEQVLQFYRIEKYDSLYSQFSKEFSSMESDSRLTPLLTPLGIKMIDRHEEEDNLIGAVDSIIGISKTFKVFSDNSAYVLKFNYEFLLQMLEPFKSDIETYKNESSNLKQQVEDLTKQLNSLSAIQFSQKNKLKNQIEEAQEDLEFATNHLNDSQFFYKKISLYLNNAKPIEEEIKAYQTHLTQVVEKFTMDYSSTAEETPVNNNSARQKFDSMFELALSDGVITEEEIEILRPFAKEAGISDGEFKLMVLNKKNFKA